MLRLRQVAAPDRNIIKGNAGEFAMRIMGNYQIAAVRAAPEQMLHILLAPVAEQPGDTPGISAVHNNVSISQQVYMDIVNQVINRVKSFVQGKAAYQDKVFVESALRSMGIRSAADFVKIAVRTAGLAQKKHRVSVLLKEKEEAAALVRTYLQKGNHPLSRLREKISGKGGKARKNTGGDRRLYDEAARRLRLAEIYALLNDISRVKGGYGRPGRQAALLSEAAGYADSLACERINREGFGIDARDIWQTWNPYERIRIMRREPGAGLIWEELLSAVLLAGVQEAALYSAMFAGPGRAWLDVSEMLSGTARLTAERFFFYHRAFQTADMENQRALMETVEEGFSREIRILGRIREIAEAGDSETDAREIKKSRLLITRFLREQQKEFREGIQEQSRGMLRAAVRIEKEIRRFILYEEIRHAVQREHWIWDSVKIVHVKNRPSGAERSGTEENRIYGGGQANSSINLRDASHREREDIKAELAGRSRKEAGRLIKETMQEQMNILTDKVYGRLEKRLLDEKRRRGM